MTDTQSSTSTKRLLRLIIAVALTMTVLLSGGILLNRPSAAQKLMRGLSAAAREGSSVGGLLAIVGPPDNIIAGSQVPNWVANATLRNHPNGDIRPSDEFYIYQRKHNSSQAVTVYLQIRDNRLVNVDPEFPDPAKANTTTLWQLPAQGDHRY